jgi:hypothetical protein
MFGGKRNIGFIFFYYELMTLRGDGSNDQRAIVDSAGVKFFNKRAIAGLT